MHNPLHNPLTQRQTSASFPWLSGGTSLWLQSERMRACRAPTPVLTPKDRMVMKKERKWPREMDILLGGVSGCRNDGAADDGAKPHWPPPLVTRTSSRWTVTVYNSWHRRELDARPHFATLTLIHQRAKDMYLHACTYIPKHAFVYVHIYVSCTYIYIGMCIYMCT